jgi:hypothetical protein
LPGLIAFFWLSSHVPIAQGASYDFGLFYRDPLYVVAGAPTWAVITAATALLVGLTVRTLGADRRAALWSMAFYGLGSPALAASRGDFPQPLVALCWAAGLYGVLRFRGTGAQRWLWVSGVAVFYGVLTRPLEGSLLLPGVVLVLLPTWRSRPAVAASQVAAWVGAVALTLLTNWPRFGSPTNPGYAASQLQWTTPIWVGFPAALISPGRGVIWEFPALILSVVGAVWFWRQGKRLEVLVLAGLPSVLFVEACQYVDWVGGWDWGFRFIQPALPLLAVLAGLGVASMSRVTALRVAAVLLAGGIIWNIPVVTTDLLGGYGVTYSPGATNWRLDAYPPIGAWKFLHHILPTSASDSAAVDIIWFRAVRVVGIVALLPFALLIAASTALWVAALGSLREIQPVRAGRS